MNKLTLSYYQTENVVEVARDLLGKMLITCIDGVRTGGFIIETEAYEGVTDRASHAYNNRRTKRTETMYMAGGVAYVYLCYGIHALLNVVTHQAGIPHAVLIRAILPVIGQADMLQRSGKEKIDKQFAVGPGKVTKALGISCARDKEPLTGDLIQILDKGICVPSTEIVVSPRIGVAYAGCDALLPYRFVLRETGLLFIDADAEDFNITTHRT